MTTTQTWLLLAFFILAVVVVVKRLQGSRTTPLRGPPRESLIFGQARRLLKDIDQAAAIQAGWAEQYGTVYRRPDAFGSSAVVLTDPKAIAHFHAAGETVYRAHPARKRFIESIVGSGILTAMGHDHKRQRRSMNASFTNSRMREYTTIFSDSAHKVTKVWDEKMENGQPIELDIAHWMNAISLDSMGLAAFGQDFEATSDRESALGLSLNTLLEAPLSFIANLVLALQPVVPILASLPTERLRVQTRIKAACTVVAEQILKDSRDAELKGQKVDPKSVLGLLMKAQAAETGLTLNAQEVSSLMRTLMLAGYDTTSTTMTWAAIKLAQYPDVQAKLRRELRTKFPSSDPSWDDFNDGLPMLDAFVHEVLRLHPAVMETNRQASQDDVIPLAHPLTLPDGTVTDKIFVAAGTTVTVPIAAVNLRRSYWGDDVHEFRPERWLRGADSLPSPVKEFQGYRHLLNFSNGPRVCLGKPFALAEFKAAFAVLVRDYEFELPQGPKTPITRSLALLERPTVVGAPRCQVPMRIRRFVE